MFFFSWSSNGMHIAPFEKIMSCISSYTHLITPVTKYKNVFWYSGKIRFIEPQGINGHGRPVPGAPPPSAAVHLGRARQCSRTGRCGPVGSYIETRIYVDADGIRTKCSMSALPFTFMMFPHIIFHETSHIKLHEIDGY